MSEYIGIELQLEFQRAEKNVRFESTHAVGIKVVVFWDISNIWAPTFQGNLQLPSLTKKEAADTS